MRQAGLKPKSHSSGVYWVRAAANPNEGRSRLEDGDPTNIITLKQKIITFMCCFWGLVGFIALSFIFF